MRLRVDATLGACVLAVILATPVGVGAEDTLESARDLYASADYRAALTMLDGLLAANPPSHDRPLIELYRTFCLVALGNTEEATAAVEAMIARDPLYRPNMEEVPPRLRAVFTESRRKLLPSIIQERYRLARTSFDRNDYKTATEGFMQVLIALADPDIAAEAAKPPLSDLGMLASNFNDLTIRAMTPAPTPRVEAPPAPAAAPPPVPRPDQIYTVADAEVAQPVTITQALPPYPGRVHIARSGILDIVIDATGGVESAEMTQPVDPSYNRMIVAAARGWMYQPARRNGTPVKFRKRIQINISPESEQPQ